MPATTTNQHNHSPVRLNQRKQQAAAEYPALFDRIVVEWNQPGPEDRAWLMYSANYLFRTAGVRWALDPLTMGRRVPGIPAPDLSQALGKLDFVMLTHRHADHLDPALLKALCHLPIQWVIPEFLLPEVQAQVALPEERIIRPQPLQSFELYGLRILPFPGLHWDASPGKEGQPQGVPAMGYRVEFNRKSWLFPGDTRQYRSDRLPRLGAVNGLFAHLWLGRASALLDPPPLLDPFCRFCLDLQPDQLVLTHLEEFGRQADDTWELWHARRVISRLQELAPRLPVSTARMGESIILE
ncbi:MAG: MBL fold metallo-hydrolase [Anaerolineales bacterium]|jgi:hypothetical protein|nr:MBL fold metallo-hydrolase [Anaerolineales bacterium]